MITEPFTAAFITDASGLLAYATYAASPEEMPGKLADTISLSVPAPDARLAEAANLLAAGLPGGRAAGSGCP